ncbi:MAG: DUF4278 domain-containing protein [Cyanobacteria bacterium P01_F01_bin.86]
MELKYRGISYQASSAHEQAAETEKMGVYRGVPYRAKSVKTLFYQRAEELVYRGVRYIR